MTWATVNEVFRIKYPNILDIMDLLLSLPAGSSECERGFSQMKNTKTQYRNRLSSNSLTLLMTIQLHSASIDDFNPDAAIHQWNKNSHRRPNFMVKRNKRSEPLAPVQDEDVTESAAEVAEEALAEDKDDNDDSATCMSDSDFSEMDFDSESE